MYTFNQYLNEQSRVPISTKEEQDNFIKFLSDKKKINPKSKIFLYHGTKIKPKKFVLKSDYDGEDGNMWMFDLPEGYLFLSTDIKEANSYGQYIIPCELERYDHVFFKINADNPSQVFDKDYDGYTDFGMWKYFQNSGKSSLVIKGITKYTIITYVENVIPRIDLAKEFYKK
jgi:hypothetical protein